MWLRRFRQTVREFREMPRLTVNLMLSATAENEPFFRSLVLQHYNDARHRRPLYLFLPRMVYGVALCPLPASFDVYYMKIEAAARRNHKKATREGCRFERLAFNDHLAEIAEIRSSAEVRQGRLMPEEYRRGAVAAIQDPESRSPLHGYPYFGVFLKDKLIGYAGCLIAGEYCGIEHILGHADYFQLGAVPYLMIGIAQYLYQHHPQVKYYCYGTYFGASETMKRFKRKFGFLPHRVDWLVDAPAPTAPSVCTPSESGS